MLTADVTLGAAFAPALNGPQGVAILQQTAAVADTANHQLVIVDLTAPAAPSQRLGARGTSAAAEGFLFPSAVAFTAADHLYVADSGNRHLDHYARAAGVWAWQNSIAPFAALNPPVGDLVDVCAVSATSLLVLEAGGRLLSVDLAAGTSAVALADARWQRPFAIGRAGNSVWIVDAATHTVYEYDQAFAAVRSFGGYGVNAGRLRTPHGIAIDAAAGRVYVAEAVGARVSVFDLAGTPIEQAVLPSDAAHGLGRGALVAAGRALFADAASNRLQGVTSLAAGVASLNVATLEFGPVGIGYRVTGTIAVQNGGAAASSVTGVSVRGAAYQLSTTSPSFPVSVPAGNTLALPITFAPTRGGRSFGEVIVTTASVAASVLSARLSGEGLAVEPVAIGLVLDTSGSMSQSSGALPKIERLHQAADLATDLLAGAGINELSVTRFSSAATVPFARATLTSANVAAAQQSIDALTAAGSTSIGGGLQASLADLSATMLTRRHLLVMTDGMENTAPMIANVPIPAGTTVYTVGLGLPQFVDAAKLETLASRNGGYFQVTDGDDLLLAKFFVQIYSDVIGQQVATDPPVAFRPKHTREFPVWITRDDRELTAVVAWEHAGAAFDVELVDPRGRSVPRANLSLVARARYLIVRVALRGTRMAAAGRWLVRVHAGALPGAQENAVVTALVDSDLHARWELEARTERKEVGEKPVDSTATTELAAFPPRGVPQPPSGLRVGDGLALRVLPATAGARITRAVLELRPPAASLADELRRASAIDLDDPKHKDTGAEKVRHASQTEHHGRVSAGGRHASFGLNLNGPDGVYWVRVQVEGMTAHHERWQRERSFHVMVHP
jgi:sugar lactone lactonase YvrE